MSTMEIATRADLKAVLKEAVADLLAENPQMFVDAIAGNGDGVRAQLERSGFIVGAGAAGDPNAVDAHLAGDALAALNQARRDGVIHTGFGARYRKACRSAPYTDPITGRQKRTFIFGDTEALCAAWFRAFLTKDAFDATTQKPIRQITDEINRATRAPTYPNTTEAGTGMGFLVPTVIAAEIFQEVAERFVLQNMVQVFTSATPLQFPKRLQRVNVTRRGQSTNVSEQNFNDKVGVTKLSPELVSAMAYVDPMLAMAAAVGPVRWIIAQFAEAIAADKQRVIATGDATVREPKGVNTLPTANSNAWENAKTATFDDTDNTTRRRSFRKLMFKVPQYHREADSFVWICNNDAVQKMADLNDTNQQPFKDPTGPVSMTNTPGAGSSAATFFGKRVVETLALATASNQTTVLGGDMNQYVFQEAPDGLTVQQTTEGGEAWNSNTIGVKVNEAYDGAPAIPTAFGILPAVPV